MREIMECQKLICPRQRIQPERFRSVAQSRLPTKQEGKITIPKVVVVLFGEKNFLLLSAAKWNVLVQIVPINCSE